VWLALPHGNTGSVVAAGALTGVAVRFGPASLPAFIVAGVPVHQSGIANGINSIARSVGSSIGSAVVTSLLTANLIKDLPAGAPALPEETQYTTAFVIGAAAFALVTVTALTGLRIDDGRSSKPLRRGSAEMPAHLPAQSREAVPDGTRQA
jgi:hypothetical protein